MLVLSRNKDESILIGDQIKVKVLKVNSNGRVKIGIDSPAEYVVLREELVIPAAELQSQTTSL